MQVLAEVCSWDLPPLPERYKKACQSLAVGEQRTPKALKTLTRFLDISFFTFVLTCPACMSLQTRTSVSPGCVRLRMGAPLCQCVASVCPPLPSTLCCVPLNFRPASLSCASPATGSPTTFSLNWSPQQPPCLGFGCWTFLRILFQGKGWRRLLIL